MNAQTQINLNESVVNVVDARAKFDVKQISSFLHEVLEYIGNTCNEVILEEGEESITYQHPSIPNRAITVAKCLETVDGEQILSANFQMDSNLVAKTVAMEIAGATTLPSRKTISLSYFLDGEGVAFYIEESEKSPQEEIDNLH